MLSYRRSIGALFLALCMSVVGCEQSKRSGIAALLPGVEPFDRLANVALNMTAQELVSARPDIRNAPYFGFQDSIQGYVVAFQFPGNVRDDMETPPGDHLTLVWARRTFADEVKADAAYRHAAQSVREILGNPSECFNVVPGRNTVHFTRWSLDSAHVYVQYSTADGLAGSETARAEPASVATVVSVNPPSIPSRLTPAPEKCPINVP